MSFWLRTAIVVAVLLTALAVLVSLAGVLPAGTNVGTAKVQDLARLKAGDPDVAATALIVVRLRDNGVLFEKNADLRLPIASLTKLMTALLLTENTEPLATVVFSQEAKRAGEPDDKRSSVPVGERIKTEDLLKMLLVSSDTDAAYAAAEYLGQNHDASLAPGALFAARVSGFIREMNQKAAALGLANTHFANPSGNDDPENFSTARDLTRLAGAITLVHPELWVASRIQETFIFSARGGRYGLVNTNPLLKEFPAIYGSKTGFDDEAKGALLILYRLAPGEIVAMALLGSPDRFGDGRELIRWLESSFVLQSP